VSSVRIPRLVLVTDRNATGGRDLVDVVAAAVDAGLRAVQLRDKDLSGRALFVLAERLRAVTARAGALLLVNERVDVAIAVGAEGVHLGGGAMPVDVARRLLPARAIVGVSTHSAAEVATTTADFAFFGPVFATPAKTSAQGAEPLRAAVAAARVPVLAIGGVTVERVADVRAAGATGVAVIRAILAAADPAAATRALIAACA
jgi:thiamine-phosphate pyrophosphorylase